MTQITEERIASELLPRDLDAERALLAAVLRDNSLLELVNERLKPENFFLDGHRTIWHLMNDRARDGQPFDAASLKRELTARRISLAKSGFTELIEVLDSAPPPAQLEPLLRRLKRKALERQFVLWIDNAQTALAQGEACEPMLADGERFFAHYCRFAAPQSKGFYPSLDDFFTAGITDPEEIIAGLRRGEVAELAAPAQQDTSTLLLNLGLSLAAGQAFPPLLQENSTPRRVLYLDCESSASRLRSELQAMLQFIAEPIPAKANFIPIVDAEVDGESLNLRHDMHLHYLESVAKDARVDVLIIDSLASAFELLNKNDADISRRVMQPLKQLARRLNCAILFAHHCGKRTASQSVLGALSNAVYRLAPDPHWEADYRVLTCLKSKGTIPKPVVLRLDVESRWFAIYGERVEAISKLPTAQEIADYVKAQGQAHTSEIVQHFAERASPRKVAACIKEASLLGLIDKTTQKKPWRSGKAEAMKEDLIILFQEDLDAERAAGKNPLAKMQKHTKYIIFQEKVPKDCHWCKAPGIQFTDCEVCGKFIM